MQSQCSTYLLSARHRIMRGMRPRVVAKFHAFPSQPKPSPSPIVSRTKLITDYGRSGEVEMAMEVFETMPHRNQVSYNAMLTALLDAGRFDAALEMFGTMPVKNARSYTSMIAGLSRAARVPEARRIFYSVPGSARNVYVWTAMLSCLAQNDEPVEALRLFAGLYGEFFARRILPNLHSFSVLLKCSVTLRSLKTAQQMQSLMVKLLDLDSEDAAFVQNALIHVYSKLGSLVDAEKIFSGMKWKDLGSWNTMMDGYARHLLMDKAIDMFRSMKEKDALSWNIMMSGLLESHRAAEALSLAAALLSSGPETKPNSSTYTIALTACATLPSPDVGRMVHASLVKSGHLHTLHVGNSLLSMYASCASIEAMEQAFAEMPHRDAVSWNTVIQGLGQNGLVGRSLEYGHRALSSNSFSANTLTAMLTSCSHGGLVVEGLELLSSMRDKYGVEPSLEHYICAVDMLGRAGRVRDAYHLLRSTPSASAHSVAWAALLNACVIHGNAEVGRIAARELQMLEPGDRRGSMGLASISGRAKAIEEPKELLHTMGQHVQASAKKLGTSWILPS